MDDRISLTVKFYSDKEKNKEILKLIKLITNQDSWYPFLKKGESIAFRDEETGMELSIDGLDRILERK